MASAPYGTLYVGVTNDIAFRAWQHREGVGSSFCRRYAVTRLVHYEVFDDISNAIHREERIKTWPRQWKVNLIEQGNPLWDDLYETLNCCPSPSPSKDRHPTRRPQGDPWDPS